jgi:integrase
MPIKLVPPKEGKTLNWYLRGNYLGIKIYKTTGTPDKRLAEKILNALEDQIERGAYARPEEPSFIDAAIKYLETGGEQRFVKKLVDYFGETKLSQIDQDAIDRAAVRIYPNATAASRNRQVYSVVSAILKRSKIRTPIDRPKGANGTRRLFFMSPAEARRLIATAKRKDPEFGLFLMFLAYTGLRLTEALKSEINKLYLNDAFLYVPTTKNGLPRSVHLPTVLVAALANHPRGLDRANERIFRFSKNGRLYRWLEQASQEAGVFIPPRVAFHAFRHSWGAWMRRYGGLDTTGLVETGAWRSRQAAAIYEHAVQSEEARKSELLPDISEGYDEVTSGKSVDFIKLPKFN